MIQIMPRIDPYLRLIRFYNPVGTFLVMWPCIWSLLLANIHHEVSPVLYLTFVIGSFVMRSAGCIINDIFDKDFDKFVSRTKNRPLASGELSVKQAILFLSLLLFTALVLLITMNKLTILLGCLTFILVVLYPLMKRFTFWPQIFFGVCFNMGILMAYTAATGKISLPAILLYVGTVLWSIGYDTIYAHQDKEDDVKAGVKSAALVLGKYSYKFINLLYKAATLFILSSALVAHINHKFFIAVLPALYILHWQTEELDLGNPDDCLKKFKSNILFGFLIALAFAIGVFY